MTVEKKEKKKFAVWLIKNLKYQIALASFFQTSQSRMCPLYPNISSKLLNTSPPYSPLLTYPMVSSKHILLAVANEIKKKKKKPTLTKSVFPAVFVWWL